jgi:uncharacterized protein (DUF433 family)
MSLVAWEYKHIVLDENSVPLIEGTGMKVIELVLAKMAYGWSAEELHFQYPYLTLGQIHSALAYYWDHRDALEQDIERGLERVDEMRQRVQPSALVTRLKTSGAF